jgi:hypothetical protein
LLEKITKRVETGTESYVDVLKQAMKDSDCSSESCLAKYIIENKIGTTKQRSDLPRMLKPFGPKNNNEWLSDSDIMRLCNIMETEFPFYKSIMIAMSDLFEIKPTK